MLGMNAYVGSGFSSSEDGGEVGLATVLFLFLVAVKAASVRVAAAMPSRAGGVGGMWRATTAAVPGAASTSSPSKSWA